MFEGLIFACPFGIEEGECPFMEIRNMNLKDKVNHYKRLDNDEKMDLLQRHKVCLNKRENTFWELNINTL